MLEEFKRKKVDKQERGTTYTSTQLKQYIDTKFSEIYDYLDDIFVDSGEKINITGGTITGDLNIVGTLQENGETVVTSGELESGLSGKLDKAGGTISGNLNVTGTLQENGKNVVTSDELTSGLSGKLDKTGGTISGSLNVTGTLQENGKDVVTSDELTSKISSIPKTIYPVGSIYLSVNSTNPSSYFGGTWTQIAKGRTLVGVDTSDSDFNTVKKTGGSKYLQEHYHDLRFQSAGGSGVTISCTGSGTSALNVTSWEWNKNDKNSLGSSSNLYTSKTGSGSSGNLPPYFTCYIWQRTA